METKEYITIDRKALGWPSGPWDSEPDKVQWPDEATGLPCLAVRNPRGGNWCGYVGVADGHPMYQKNYFDLDIEVHGGLTFANMCHPGDTEATGICHVPGIGEPEHVWWLGFDCAHAWDYSLQDMKDSERGYTFNLVAEGSYKTLQYVKNECQRLAAQLQNGENRLRKNTRR